MRRERLDGDRAIEECVMGLVDHAHAAFAELLVDAIAVLEERADHWSSHLHQGAGAFYIGDGAEGLDRTAVLTAVDAKSAAGQGDIMPPAASAGSVEDVVS